jgi:hypothetical protein
MIKDYKENTAKWLKRRSQTNRVNRFQQLELDFGSDFEKTMENRRGWKEQISGEEK